MPRFSAGTVLLGKYRIERLLGKGGFAEVYLATHLHLQAPRALKIVTQSTQRLKRVLARFQLEARLGAQLAQAEGIVRVYDYEPDPKNGLYVLVMEYMPGGSLKDRLRQAREGLPVEAVVRLAQEAAQGLLALHSQGYVHRDIKPSNILFDARDRAKIADLGIVQTPDHTTRMGGQARSHPGTPLYMSPEQENSTGPLPPASDIYSLGAVLFEALTLKQYKRVRPGTRVSQLRSDVPSWLDELVARMLAPVPKDRPWDAAELLEYLERRRPPRETFVSTPSWFTESTSATLDDDALTDLVEDDVPASGAASGVAPPPPPPPSPSYGGAGVADEATSPTPSQEQLPPTPTPPEAQAMPFWVAHAFHAPGPVQALATHDVWVFVGVQHAVLAWHSQVDNITALYGHGGYVTALVPLPSAPGQTRFVSAGHDGQVLVWSFPQQKTPVHGYTPAPYGIRHLALQPITRGLPYLAGVDIRGHIYLWQGLQPEPVLHFQAGKAEPADLAWLDAQHLVLAEVQGRLTIWRISPSGARPVRKWRYPTGWTALAIQGRTALLGSESGYVWMLSLDNGHVIRRHAAHQDQVVAVAFVGEGFVSVGWDRRLLFWRGKQSLWETTLPATPLSTWMEGSQTLWIGCHDGTVLRVSLIPFLQGWQT